MNYFGCGIEAADARGVLLLLVVVILTLTRIIKSLVAGHAPVSLELRNTPGKKHKAKSGTRAYIIADC